MGWSSSIPCQVLVHFSSTTRRWRRTEVLNVVTFLRASQRRPPQPRPLVLDQIQTSLSIFVIKKLIMHDKLKLHVAADSYCC